MKLQDIRPEVLAEGEKGVNPFAKKSDAKKGDKDGKNVDLDDAMVEYMKSIDNGKEGQRMKSLDDAKDGMQAFLDGKELSDNPNKSGEKADAWVGGWQTMKRVKGK
jgi:hypothetical protein